MLRELETERISINFHHFCLTPENFTRCHHDLKDTNLRHTKVGLYLVCSATNFDFEIIPADQKKINGPY